PILPIVPAPDQLALVGIGMFADGVDPQHARNSKGPPNDGQHDRQRRNQPQRHGQQPAKRKQNADPYRIPYAVGSGELPVAHHADVLAPFEMPQDDGHDEDGGDDQAQYARQGQQDGHGQQGNQIQLDGEEADGQQ